MCGIAGLLTQHEDTCDVVRRMIGSLHHRGPDDRGAHLSRTAKLGSTRLAIIDLSPNGHMPMENPETGDVLVFNGEIYNHSELRSELEGHGCRFHSQGDTEVVLRAYERWGVNCFDRLRGMFSIGLWDERRSELILARDRMGEKPLYYFQDQVNSQFVFASEVRALLASGLVPRTLDEQTLSIYLFNGFTIAPRTMIQGVRSLLPGCWARIASDGAIRQEYRYWRLPRFTPHDHVDDDELRAALADAVKVRLVSDVPLGVFLSGGLDSSTIVALVSRFSAKVRTFSIGFSEAAYDETPHARRVAQRFDTQHTEIRLGQDEFSAWLDDSLGAIDQPTFDGLNTYFVSRAARESGIAVALSGLGADELFGGYPCFRSAPVLAKMVGLARWIPSFKAEALVAMSGALHGPRKGLHVLGQPTPPGLELLAAYQSSMALFPVGGQEMRAEGVATEQPWFGLPREFLGFLRDESEKADTLGQLSQYALRIFGGERTLRDGDAMSMATSLEVRTIFSDHRLIEALWRVPGRRRCAGAPDKRFERRLVRPILGPEYQSRRKQGFTFPFQEWLKSSHIRRRLDQTLHDASLALASGINPDTSASVAIRGASLPWSRLWALFVLLDWVRRHRVTL